MQSIIEAQLPTEEADHRVGPSTPAPGGSDEMPTAQILAVSTRDHPDSTSEFTNAGGKQIGTRKTHIGDHVPIAQSAELRPPAGSHGGTEIPATKTPDIKLDSGTFATGK